MLYAKVFGSIVINLGMNADENSEKNCIAMVCRIGMFANSIRTNDRLSNKLFSHQFLRVHNQAK